MKYKVVIPSAGIGRRLGLHTKHINKGIVSIGDKPAICRVIDKFDDNLEIIILVGYKSEILIEVVKQFYPSRKIKFVDVDKYEGEGSGLGYSLNKARKHLMQPFIFVPNDTLVGDEVIDLDPNLYGNWAAYYQVDSHEDVEQYRTLNIDNDQVVNLNPKGIDNKNVYVGICGIVDYEKFWDALACEESQTVGESFGLNRLNNVKAVKLEQWYDTGSLKKLTEAKLKYKNVDVNILDKEDEAIWFNGKEVIKFNIDPKFIHDRVKRIYHLPNKMLPKLINSKKYTYKYTYIEGEVVASSFNSKSLIEFCDLCKKELWEVSECNPDDYIKGLKEFYKDKTFSRVQHYYDRFEQKDSNKIINGKDCLPVNKLLNNIDWKDLCENNHISNFHGDLHGENIIKNHDNYLIIDWRQSFNGNVDFGDAYYDLAKLRHGLLVNHGMVDKNLYYCKELDNGIVNINIHQHSNLIEADKVFLEWLKTNKFSVKKVKILTALIYLNVCGLHEFPYSKFLYYYGQYLLQDYLNEQ